MSELYSSQNPKIQAALRAKRDGHPDMAIGALEEIIESKKANPLVAAELMQLWRSTLRDRLMVSDFLKDLGWTKKQFKGFDHLDDAFVQKLKFEYVAKTILNLFKKNPKNEIPLFIFREDCLTRDETFLENISYEGETYFPARLYSQGQNFLKEEEVDQALDCFILAGVLEPSFRQAHLQAAKIFFKLGNSRRAAELFDKASIYPDIEWHDCLKDPLMPSMVPRFIERMDDGYSIFYWRGTFFCCKGIVAVLIRKFERQTFKRSRDFKKLREWIRSKFEKQPSTAKTHKPLFAKTSQSLRSTHSKRGF